MKNSAWICTIGALFGALTAGAAEKKEPSLVVVEVALYYAPQPKKDPLPLLKKLCAESHPRVWMVEGKPGPKSELPAVLSHWVPLEKYAPPGAQAWSVRARGVPPAMQGKLAAAKQVLVLEFVLAPNDAVTGNRVLGQIVAALADATNGLPWDEESRGLFTAADWRRKRVDSWEGGLPDISQHVVQDFYQHGDSKRVVTLGLRKFGLPDIAATDVTDHGSTTLSAIMNLAAQTMVEGRRPQDGRLAVDLSTVRQSHFLKSIADWVPAGGTRKAVLLLKPTERQEGDAQNELLDLDFEAKGRTKAERLAAAAAQAFGVDDKIIDAKADDQELNAARDRARARLPELRAHFARGFAEREMLAVKAGFDAPGHQKEYMWVEAKSWKGLTISGTLMNPPYYVKNLKEGAYVTVNEEAVFDWIWRKPDGTTEGGETNRILERK